jgi:hypothetical protein
LRSEFHGNLRKKAEYLSAHRGSQPPATSITQVPSTAIGHRRRARDRDHPSSPGSRSPVRGAALRCHSEARSAHPWCIALDRQRLEGPPGTVPPTAPADPYGAPRGAPVQAVTLTRGRSSRGRWNRFCAWPPTISKVRPGKFYIVCLLKLAGLSWAEDRCGSAPGPRTALRHQVRCGCCGGSRCGAAGKNPF